MAKVGAPVYTIAEAKTTAQELLKEPYGSDPWEARITKYDECKSVYNRVVAISKDKTPILATRASILVDETAETLFKTFWYASVLSNIRSMQAELKWNVGTVASMEIVTDNGDNQVIYQQHKVLSAATPKRDVLFERQYWKEADGSFFIAAVSTTSVNKPEPAGYTRANLVFSGLELKAVAPNKCEVSWAWCFDFNGWVHAKFVEAVRRTQ